MHMGQEAVDVLGELDEVREQLHEAEQCAARSAEAAAAAQGQAKQAAQLASANNELSARVAALEAQLQQCLAAGQSAGATALNHMQSSAPPSEPAKLQNNDVAEPSALPGADNEVVELKARLGKAKRQALAFKAKASEAATARDAALEQAAELRLVQVRSAPIVLLHILSSVSSSH